MEIISFDITDLFIQKVHAQAGLDGLTQPTFGDLEVGDTTETQADVRLQVSDELSPAVGSLMHIDIYVETKDIAINGYDLVIQFDSNYLSVVDAYPDDQYTDPQYQGVQIEFHDELFQLADGGNIVTEGDRIRLTANALDNAEYKVNRKVGTITFQPQQQGTTNIQIVDTGAVRTRLLRFPVGIIDPNPSDRLSLPYNKVDIIGIQILSEGQQTSTNTYTGPTTSSSSTSTQTATSSSSSSQDTIPDTGLADDISANIPLLIGVGLVAFGVLLSRFRQTADE